VAKKAKVSTLEVNTTMLPPSATMPAPEPATALSQPAEAKRELSNSRLATTLPSLVEEAVVRGLGGSGPIIVLSPPAEVAAVRTPFPWRRRR
jgi:hypothetical protein